MLSHNSLQRVVLPAPDGADTIKSDPFIADARFCLLLFSNSHYPSYSKKSFYPQINAK